MLRLNIRIEKVSLFGFSEPIHLEVLVYDVSRIFVVLLQHPLT